MDAPRPRLMTCPRRREAPKRKSRFREVHLKCSHTAKRCSGRPPVEGDMLALSLAMLSLALQPGSRPAIRPSFAFEMSGVRVEVCQNKYCKKKGAAATLKLLQELVGDRNDVQVVVADMTHTEHGCFDECTMGPNVRIGGEPQGDDGRVYNGIKTEAMCSELLEKAAAAART